MTKHNPFSSSNHDLGIDEYGYSMDGVTEEFLHMAYTNIPKCYVCMYNPPKYRVEAKNSNDTTAELQKGLYVCGHCIQLKPLDSKRYALTDISNK